MALIEFLRKSFSFSKARCPFKSGDQVQPLQGGPLMVVEWTKSTSQPNAYLVCCKWFDRQSKKNRLDIFFDWEIKPFDWYNPH